jgi:hypothetical protein
MNWRDKQNTHYIIDTCKNLLLILYIMITNNTNVYEKKLLISTNFCLPIIYMFLIIFHSKIKIWNINKLSLYDSKYNKLSLSIIP